MEQGAGEQDSNPAPPSDSKSEQTNVLVPGPPITEALLAPSVHHFADNTRGETKFSDLDR